MSGGTRTKKRAPTKRKKALKITGEVVPRGALEPNSKHPSAELSDNEARREAFLDELAEALAELPSTRSE